LLRIYQHVEGGVVLKEVEISTDIIKLDQFLKWVGIAESGSMAKEMIMDGIVKVNGITAHERGKKLHKGDTVSVEDMDDFIIR
jgi:ribosome-associated protein